MTKLLRLIADTITKIAKNDRAPPNTLTYRDVLIAIEAVEFSTNARPITKEESIEWIVNTVADNGVRLVENLPKKPASKKAKRTRRSPR
jgi:hypothetical protein